MDHIWLTLLLLLLPQTATQALAKPRCGNCGRTPVPYPLSTGPNCGDQSYKIRCAVGTLWFDADNRESYQITSIDPTSQRIVVKPASLVGNTCVSSDYRTQGIQLDPNLPFNITGSNTILLLNCTDAMLNLQAPINCSANSICHDYIRRSGAAACLGTRLCCVFRTGGSQNSYVIRIHSGGCAAFQSFVDMDANAAVKKWPEPGVELEWQLPMEPPCKVPADCRELVKSKCMPSPQSGGGMRCLCNAGFKWDPINGVCKKFKCKHGKGCKLKKKTPLIGGAVVAVVGVIVLISTGFLLHKQRIKKETKRRAKSREEMLNTKSLGKSAKIFTGKEITKATNNFSKDNLIGTGGFGEVFKAVLEDGTVTAVKRAKLTTTKGTECTGTDQVLNEVRILCQVNHRSLVRLLGCCVDHDEPLLIYEYISNGTLFDILHGHHGSIPHRSVKSPPLTWPQRLRIAHQTAEALAYLHFAAVPPIYHRDVKSSNILLDDKLDAKVADFGLSRLVERTEVHQTHIFTGAQGTLGYLDPEYYRNFQLTDKSDVYSYGVVLLELLTSKKAIDFSRDEEEVNLVLYVKKLMSEERLVDAIDPAMKLKASDVEIETMKALGFLAGACLEEQRQNRPSMKEAADEIEYIMSVLNGNVSQAKL